MKREMPIMLLPLFLMGTGILQYFIGPYPEISINFFWFGLFLGIFRYAKSETIGAIPDNPHDPVPSNYWIGFSD